MASKDQSQQGFTVILIGRVGNGKSSTGNTIIGSKCFRAVTGTKPVTQETQAKLVSTIMNEHEITITVIDTPGLMNGKELLTFKDFISKHKRGVCVFLYVIRIGRFTDEDKRVLKHVLIQKGVGYRTGIVLTNKDELQSNHQTVEEWLRETPSLLKLFTDKYIAHVAIENRSVDQQLKQQHRQELLTLIEGLSKKSETSSGVSDLKSRTPEKIPEKIPDEIQERMCTTDSKQSITVTLPQLKQRFGDSGVQFFNEMTE